MAKKLALPVTRGHISHIEWAGDTDRVKTAKLIVTHLDGTVSQLTIEVKITRAVTRMTPRPAVQP